VTKIECTSVINDDVYYQMTANPEVIVFREQMMADLELIRFREQFQAYLKSVPSEILGPLMLNNPGEKWRIMMIKSSGLILPKSLMNAIKQYEDKNQKEEEMINSVRLFLDDYNSSIQKTSHSKRDLYTSYRKWHDHHCDGKALSFKEFRLVIDQCQFSCNEKKSADALTYKLLKLSVII
jgi:hypothetical protein